MSPLGRRFGGLTALALVVGTVIGILAGTPAVRAATLAPDTTADEFDPVADGDCSLREAVESTLRDADFGGCVGEGVYGDDLIVLQAAVYTLDRSPGSETFIVYDNSGGDLDTEDEPFPTELTRLEIVGQGRDVTVIERSAAAEPFRIFHTSNNVSFRLADLTVRNGLDANGGGILARSWDLTLERVAVRDNRVENSTQPSGGGVFFTGARLEILDSLIVDNVIEAPPDAHGATGGGLTIGSSLDIVIAPTGTVDRRIVGSTLAGNRILVMGETPAIGGGLAYGHLRYTDTEARPLEIVDSTISGNSAGVGGGIYLVSTSGLAPMVLEHVTVTDNEATDTAGGVYAFGRHFGFPTFTFGNTLIAGNRAPEAPDCTRRDDPIDSVGVNLLGIDDPGPYEVCLTAPPDLVGTLADPLDPRLGALADHGGLTPTHALLDDSPAVDAAPGIGVAVDQRDVPRPQGLGFDIGAFELERAVTDIPAAGLLALLLTGFALVGAGLRMLR
jgi:CSLREA domain-containing protein